MTKYETWLDSMQDGLWKQRWLQASVPAWGAAVASSGARGAPGSQGRLPPLSYT